MTIEECAELGSDLDKKTGLLLTILLGQQQIIYPNVMTLYCAHQSMSAAIMN